MQRLGSWGRRRRGKNEGESGKMQPPLPRCPFCCPTVVKPRRRVCCQSPPWSLGKSESCNCCRRRRSLPVTKLKPPRNVLLNLGVGSLLTVTYLPLSKRSAAAEEIDGARRVAEDVKIFAKLLTPHCRSGDVLQHIGAKRCCRAAHRHCYPGIVRHCLLVTRGEGILLLPDQTAAGVHCCCSAQANAGKEKKRWGRKVETKRVYNPFALWVGQFLLPTRLPVARLLLHVVFA